MVKFIKQEADEKANEIAVSAEEVGSHRFRMMYDLSYCMILYQAYALFGSRQAACCNPSFDAPSMPTGQCAYVLHYIIDLSRIGMCSHILLFLLQEFNIEKLQLLEAEKAKIRKDYERREGQIDVKKKM